VAKARKPTKRKTALPSIVQPVPVEALHWRCPVEELKFESTAEVEPVAGVVGQDPASAG
jgi:hypothetical protein